VPVTLREYLTLMEAMEKDLAGRRVEDFYYLSRAALVKDERNLDKFDRVFGHVFKGLESTPDALIAEIPTEWLKKLTEKYLTDEEKKLIEALGGLDKLLETLRERLKEQKGRHQGGKKWIGTAGTSPFGAYGYNPEGVRIGQDGNRNFRAVKVWDKREFKDLADDVELGTRNIKIALRRLRKFARTGAAEELDLDGTIKGTAHKGYLDILMRPERHNSVKVLLFFDIGGSMDWHIKATEELFSAARSEFMHMEHFYFHNFPYERLWKDNRRRLNFTSTTQVMRYQKRISGPLLDRIDIHIDVPAVKFRDLTGEISPETDDSDTIRDRVIAARDKQKARLAEEKIFSNAAMKPRLIRRYCAIDTESEQMLERAMTRLGLSARAYDRILKVSRTIADLENSDKICSAHVAEAVGYRSLDRTYWI